MCPNKNHEETLQYGWINDEGHVFSSQENRVLFSALPLTHFMVLGKWFHFLFPFPLWQSCWFRLQAFVPGHVSRGYLNINYKKQTFTTDQEDDHWTKEARAHFLFGVFPFCLANVGPRWMMTFPKYSLPYVIYHGGDTSLVLSFKSCPLSKKRQSLFWHHISCSSSSSYQPEHERPR